MDRHDNPLTGLPTREQASDRDAALDRAVAILSVHVPEPGDGTCRGCLTLWDRWIGYDACPQVEWARRAVETYAAWDDNLPGLTAPDASELATR